MSTATPKAAASKHRRLAAAPPKQGGAAPRRAPLAAAAKAGRAGAAAPAALAAAKEGRTPQADPAKAERVKLVRDSFTMPESDFEMIDALKQRAIKRGREVKKSELLRAGLHALAALGDAAFDAVIAAIPRLKTGRPHAKKGK